MKDKSICSQKLVHFSIDDVDLNHSSNSLFENYIIKYLKFTHNIFNAKYNLYIFDLNTTDISPNLISKFHKYNHWLKLGFHGIKSNDFDPYELKKGYISNISSINEKIREIGGKEVLTNTIRLHYYYADDEMIKLAYENGARTLLAPELPNRLCYNLDSTDSSLVYTQRLLQKNSISYRHTDIRLENEKLLTIIKRTFKKDDPLIIYTHSWSLNKKNLMKMTIMLFFLRLNNYTFITDFD